MYFVSCLPYIQVTCSYTGESRSEYTEQSLSDSVFPFLWVLLCVWQTMVSFGGEGGGASPLCLWNKHNYPQKTRVLKTRQHPWHCWELFAMSASDGAIVNTGGRQVIFIKDVPPTVLGGCWGMKFPRSLHRHSGERDIGPFWPFSGRFFLMAQSPTQCTFYRLPHCPVYLGSTKSNLCWSLHRVDYLLSSPTWQFVAWQLLPNGRKGRRLHAPPSPEVLGISKGSDRWMGRGALNNWVSFILMLTCSDI